MNPSDKTHCWLFVTHGPIDIEFHELSNLSFSDINIGDIGPNGTSPRGISLNDTSPSGISLGDASPSGISPSGISHGETSQVA
jgi:hypothetical protein